MEGVVVPAVCRPEEARREYSLAEAAALRWRDRALQDLRGRIHRSGRHDEAIQQNQTVLRQGRGKAEEGVYEGGILMGRKPVNSQKKYIRNRVSEIIQDYLYDEDESYAYIAMYFEKKNGENQTKCILFGKPSSITPDIYRDEPEGFDDVDTEFPIRSFCD